ncbi:MAG: hypothetical protein PHX08_08180 [Lachnospiraceae bacterium]|nr:hypothetical protein [Lachnospiraceae bacterium]
MKKEIEIPLRIFQKHNIPGIVKMFYSNMLIKSDENNELVIDRDALLLEFGYDDNILNHIFTILIYNKFVEMYSHSANQTMHFKILF